MFELDDQQLVTLGLIERYERMNSAEARPGNRNQLGRRIQFHGAGTERDHAAIEREILIRQPAHVTHQVGFRMMTVKYRVSQEIAFAHQVWRQTAAGFFIQAGDGNLVTMVVGKHVKQGFNICPGSDFIQ